MNTLTVKKATTKKATTIRETSLTRAATAALAFLLGIVDGIRGRVDARSERGDVPGWVLIAVMTAGLTAAIWTLADTQLKAMMSTAFSAVTRR